MRSRKNILYMIVFVMLLATQVAYLMTIYKEDKLVIEANYQEIRMNQRRLAQLETYVKQLPETKKELAIATSEKMAMLDSIPTFESGSKESAELMRYINMNDFMSIDFKMIENEEMPNYNDQAVGTIIKHGYELTFVGRYKDAQSFIDHLNRSYQIINIESMELDNSVQNLEDDKNLPYYFYYGDDFNTIVKIALQFTMYNRRDENKIAKEIYQQDLNMRTSQENVFSWVQATSQEESTFINQEKEGSKDLFTLLVGDILNSGDTYKFEGPGKEGQEYMGLTSEVNVEMNLVIRKDGYDVKIKDAEGQEEATSILVAIENPEMSVISTMRAINEVMPNVHINVDNQTDKEMTINLKGSLTDHIHVYNGEGEQVGKGQLKGKIRLI